MRRKTIGLMIVAVMVAIGTVLDANGTLADNSHVEDVVEPQDGIEVVQHGRSGLVEVEVTTCLVAGESFTFEMIVSADREGSSTLSIRKQGNPDVSDWLSVSPKTVDLPSMGTKVTVKIEPPVGADLDRKAVTRIQEIGDGPTPGGHHGVKVAISCVEMPNVPLATTPTLPLEERPSPTPTPTATSTVQPPRPTPEPKMPKGFPDTGGEPLDEERGFTKNDLLPVGLTTILVGSGLIFDWKQRRIY